MKLSKTTKGIIIGAVSAILGLLIIFFIIGVVTSKDNGKDESIQQPSNNNSITQQQDSDNSSKNNGSLDSSNDKADIIEGKEGSYTKRQNAISLGLVQTSQLYGNPLVDVYSEFFSNRQWKAFHDDTTDDYVVQFSGSCQLNGKEVNIVIHWTVNNNKIVPAGFSIDGEQASLKDLNDMNDAASEEYTQNHVAG